MENIRKQFWLIIVYTLICLCESIILQLVQIYFPLQPIQTRYQTTRQIIIFEVKKK